MTRIDFYRYAEDKQRFACRLASKVFDSSARLVVYSPDAPRYVSYKGLVGVRAQSADLTVRTPWYHRLAATGGVGYSHLAGPAGGGYAYWSAGGIVNLGAWSISLSYVNTDSEASALFYSAAARDRCAATVIWRF